MTERAHPSTQELTQLVAGLLAPSRAAVVQGHLGTCARCVSTARALRETFHGVATALAPASPPPALKARVLASVAELASPLWGREVERELLAGILSQLLDGGGARLVSIQGPAGVGKTRLAEWLGARALALRAEVWKATHSPLGQPGDGVPGLLARLGGSVAPPAADAEVLRAWAHPSEGPPARDARLARRAAFGRLAASRERGVLLWIEDAERARETLEVALELMRAQRGRVLIVVTRRLGEAADPTTLGALEATDGAVRVVLAPLEPPAARALARSLPAVTPELLEPLVARAQGSPLLLIQLACAWSVTGARKGPAEARDDARACLEGTIDQVGEAGALALEVAAALGEEVDLDVWLLTCVEAGVEVPASLVERLLGCGLARRLPQGFALAHGLYREILHDRAQTAGRSAAHHRAAATVLGRTQPRGQAGLAARLAGHWLSAERPAQALPWLVRAAAESRVEGDHRAARPWYRQADQVMEALGIGDDDPRRVDLRLEWARSAREDLAIAEAEELLERLETTAARTATPHLAAEIAWNRGKLAVTRGDRVGAMAAYRLSLAGFLELGDAGRAGRTLVSLGFVQMHQGEPEAAEASLQRAEALLAQGDDALELALCARGLGMVLAKLGAFEAAEHAFDTALARYQEAGSRVGLAATHNERGEMSRFRDDPAAAEASYRRALAIAEQVGAHEVRLVAGANLSLCALAQGRYAEARDGLTGWLAEFARYGRGYDLDLLRVELLPCLAAQAEWAAFDATLAAARAGLAASGAVDPDVAAHAELAGDLATERGQPARARRAYALALEQWRGIGAEVRAEALTARLD